MVKSIIYLARTEDRISFVDWVMETLRADFPRSERPKVLVKPNIESQRTIA